MATWGVEWVTDPVAAWMTNYATWARNITEAVHSVVSARAAEIEQWMKENHTWQNRTHLAESSLFCRTFIEENLAVEVVMGYGWDVYYSRFLEKLTRTGGASQFSVLIPALEYWSPILLDDVRRALA